MTGGSWRGKRVSDMTGAGIADMAGAAPGVVGVRLLGASEDVARLAAILRAVPGLEVIRQSGQRPNRRDSGVRVYLTITARPSKEGQR